MSKIEAVLQQQEGADHCGPACIRTLLLLAAPPQQREGIVSQPEIGRQVFVTGEDESDIWCPPENIQHFLAGYFSGVGLVEGEASGIKAVESHLANGEAVMVLIQDKFPDLTHPEGYPDDGKQGHYVLITNVNEVESWVEVADPSRLVDGNERWFDNDGIVLAESYTGQAGYESRLSGVYRVRLNDFLPQWWDNRVPPQPGRYQQPFIWVDLDSRR